MSDNYRKAPKSHRPCFCFMFQSIEDSKKFFQLAVKRQDTHLVQHPYSRNGSGKRLEHQVLVTGTGSMLFDTNMKQELMKKAHELNGHLVPV